MPIWRKILLSFAVVPTLRFRKLFCLGLSTMTKLAKKAFELAQNNYFAMWRQHFFWRTFYKNYRVQAKSFEIGVWTFFLEFKSRRGPKNRGVTLNKKIVLFRRKTWIMRCNIFRQKECPALEKYTLIKQKSFLDLIS